MQFLPDLPIKRPTALSAAWLILIGLPGSVTLAEDALTTLHHSFDVTVQRGGEAGPTFDDEAAISETAVPAWSATALGSLPSGADLTSLHKANDGRWYFSLDTFATLGGVNVGPEDVVAWNGSTSASIFIFSDGFEDMDSEQRVCLMAVGPPNLQIDFEFLSPALASKEISNVQSRYARRQRYSAVQSVL